MDTHPSDRLLACVTARRTARDLALGEADLRSARLAGLRADGLDLHESDLRDSMLAGVKWRACTLRDARLERADLSGAILRLCVLDDVRAMDTRLVSARIENSQARGARFDGADFTGAVLDDSDFSRSSLQGAIMDGVSASGADLRGADLRGARLRGAALADADLRGADLRGADLEGADLDGADLRGAIRSGAKPPAGANGDFPEELQPLVRGVAPIVAQVLRTAGQQAIMDPTTARKLVDEAARLRGDPPETGIEAGVVTTVSRILPRLGSLLPELAQALRQPPGAEPPQAVREMILALREELGLGDVATTDDVLASLLGRPESGQR
jgi:uncharacterized protein YjbI with pentapeptide repeats